WELDTLEVTPDPFISKLKIGEPELLLLLENLKFKTYLRFDLLLDLTAVDCSSHFTLVYLLYSTHLGHRVMVKCDIPREKSRILSVCKLYPAAEVLEREVYDLMGIKFVGHPNLKRIILADDFVGHPLRKDYRPAEQEVSNG
ncbi:MAG: NADH-quinone oxidoreductase subunit C, partial [Syntrophomonadaceae bacterium]|nr:NADH-quinone oxidoreductase subunit C [Syntrophomonadaceae bacterium]